MCKLHALIPAGRSSLALCHQYLDSFQWVMSQPPSRTYGHLIKGAFVETATGSFVGMEKGRFIHNQ